MRYRDRDTGERIIYVEQDDSGGGGLGWFVLGAALGAGVALLLAPQSGARTRRDLGRRLGDWKERAEEKLESLADGIEEGAERIRERVEHWGGAAAEGESAELDESGEAELESDEEEEPELTAREELERRLVEARARRRRPELTEEEPVA